MIMRILTLSIFIVFFSSIFGINSAATTNCNPMEVYMDCYITARNEYLAGNYSYQLYRNFVEDYCVSASNSCPDY